jgi:hypothetical protein
MAKAATKKKPSFQEVTRVEEFQRSCRVELTAKEVADRADRASHLVAEIDAKDADRKAAAKSAASQIEELEAELRRISNEVRDKATYRLVDCERKYDYRVGTVTELRTDTREILHMAPMTDAERQLRLGLESPESPTAEGQKLGDAVANDAPPLPTQKRGKPKQGKGRRAPRAEARA